MKKNSRLSIIQKFLDKHNILVKKVDCDTIRERKVYNKHFIDHDEWVIMGQAVTSSSMRGYIHLETLLLSRKNKPFTLNIHDKKKLMWDGYKLYTV